jgi:hypothetical protein
VGDIPPSAIWPRRATSILRSALSLVTEAIKDGRMLDIGVGAGEPPILLRPIGSRIYRDRLGRKPPRQRIDTILPVYHRIIWPEVARIYIGPYEG